MSLHSFHCGGGRGAAYNCREGYGELIATHGDRMTILCAETGDLIDVHVKNTNPEPTEEEIYARAAELRSGWSKKRLRDNELYRPTEAHSYTG